MMIFLFNELDEAAMSKLWDKTRTLLRESKIPLRQMATEVDLSYGWLMNAKYGNGNRPDSDPSVSKVEKLYEYLTGHTLKV